MLVSTVMDISLYEWQRYGPAVPDRIIAQIEFLSSPGLRQGL